MNTKAKTLVIASALLALIISTFSARAFYDPGLGRWMNRDSLGEAGFERIHRLALPTSDRGPLGVNLYTYVRNNTPNAIDPKGLIDSITGYFRGCAELLSAESRCECYCAIVTTGSDDSTDCVRGCLKCEQAVTKGVKGTPPDPKAMCMCLCGVENERRKKNGQKERDCGKLCDKICPKKKDKEPPVP